MFAGSVIGDWAFGVVISLYAYDKGGAATLGVVRYLTKLRDIHEPRPLANAN